MPDPSELTAIFSGVWGNLLPQLISITKYVVYLVVISVVGWIVYSWATYTIKVEVFQLYGSGKDGVFSFGKPKMNRVKWIRNKTAWKKLFPLFNRKEIEPFDDEYIYPGKIIKAFELNDEWIPIRINIGKEEDELRGELNSVPYHVRNWQSLQHKKHAIEFAMTDWWSDNKTMFTALIVCGLCLAAVCVTIYFTYEHANGIVFEMKRLTGGLQMKDVIPGIAP